ncbi:hypothetical protein VPFG_00153 [Vibrio phage nt-1]|uniref:Uncharacterized protein n=1 Tax=Vibrio phage nt-1 TaxID=115992 RepID=R9TIF6_9CAUD|nr:hypothetical protein VPFG_00153 [Vibrio phage nt-1]AGN30155.1 hypothetical protein VPFG_00153 [Vibrio phage nt-1]
MTDFLIAAFCFTFFLANVGSIFTMVYIATAQQYNIPMIILCVYGFIGTIGVMIVIGLVMLVSWIEESKFWKKISKMRDI